MTPKERKRALYRARIALREENRKQTPNMSVIPKELWPTEIKQRENAPIKAWRSYKYLAQLYREGDYLRLSINRAEIGNDGKWEAGLSWEELMEVKSECGFDRHWAVEIYPADSEVVNVANMRHLWIQGGPTPYGWRTESPEQLSQPKEE